MKCSTPFFLRLPVTSTNSHFPSESPLIFMSLDGNYCILFFYHNLNYITLSCVSSTFIVPPYCINHPSLLFPCTSLELLEHCLTCKKKNNNKKKKIAHVQCIHKHTTHRITLVTTLDTCVRSLQSTGYQDTLSKCATVGWEECPSWCTVLHIGNWVSWISVLSISSMAYSTFSVVMPGRSNLLTSDREGIDGFICLNMCIQMQYVSTTNPSQIRRWVGNWTPSKGDVWRHCMSYMKLNDRSQ